MHATLSPRAMCRAMRRAMSRALWIAAFAGLAWSLPAQAGATRPAATPGPTTAPLPVATPAPVVGPRTDPAAIPHTNVIALPLIANMTNLPPQVAEAAAAYAGQTQYTPGAGVARTITAYSVGITLLPAGSAPVAEPGTLASPQVDVVVRAPSRPATGPAALTAVQIAYGQTLMPGAVQVQAVAPIAPAPYVPASVVAKTDAPIVASPAAPPAVTTAPGSAPITAPVAPPTPGVVAVSTTGRLVGTCCGAPAAPAVAVSPAAQAVLPMPAAILIDANAESVVCNSFDAPTSWAAQQKRTDIWTDWYGGWAPFAVDDGFRQAKNTTFSMERVVGPGKNYGDGYSVKIASNQPYAGGFGSPLLRVPPGSTVTVRVKYLIWDYIQNPDDAHRVRDWASMGIKPDAHGAEAVYVNGYVRGQWAQLTNSVIAGRSGEVMVLLQGESVASVNSNIYFDEVQVFVDGGALEACVHE